RFRVSGRAPEIWRADTGKSEPVSYRIENGITIVPLEFAAEDSFFVLFRRPADAQILSVAKPALQPVADLSNAWSVSFQAGRGAPAAATLSALTPLNENAEPAVKYFSGVATY